MHRQIYGTLRRYILGGQIPAHTLLPSTRSLAEDLKVGRNTVIAAYDQLLAEGFLEARTGSGTWVAPILQRPDPMSPAHPLPFRPERLSRRGRTIVDGATATAQCRRHQLPPRRARQRVVPVLDLEQPAGAQRAQPRREPAGLPVLRRASRPAADHRQRHQRIARDRLPARSGDHRHRRPGGARSGLARADGRRRPCLDGGARISRRQERLSRQRRAAGAAQGEPAWLGAGRPRAADAAPDLRHALLPVALRHDHADRGAAAAPGHRRAVRGLDHRGRL